MLWKTLTCRTTLFLPGGEDFDQRVMDHFIKLYKKKKGKDIRKDNRAVQKLRREVEKAKRALSSQHQVRVEVESLFDGEDFSEQLTRAKFEELNMVSWKVLCVWCQVECRELAVVSFLCLHFLHTITVPGQSDRWTSCHKWIYFFFP